MFDLIILGGGPAGYRAAERAAQAGLRVCLFEKRAMGGVCLHEGCIPSKALLYSAKLFESVGGSAKPYGVSYEKASLDYRAAVRHKDKVVKSLADGIETALKALHVTIIRDHAQIEGKDGNGFRVGGQRGKNLLIATGSEPVIPPMQGADRCMTTREIFALTEAPKTLAIIGGGAVGLEMAGIFHAAGSSITVYEMLDKIAGPMDREIAGMLQRAYEKKGIAFKLGAAVGDISELGADAVLLCAGRRAVTKGIGLETIGVYVDKGAIVTDDQMKTNVPGVFAAGDCNGKSMLAHTAYREAEVAVHTILGKKDIMRYDAIPSVIYTNPEAAGCGETLESAREKGISAAEKKLSLRFSGRFAAENESGSGLCKLVYAGDRVIGIHMLGNPASEIIAAASMAIDRRMTLAQLQKVIFPHPTVGEIIREAAFL